MMMSFCRCYLPRTACFCLTFLVFLWPLPFFTSSDPVDSLVSSAGAVHALFPTLCPAETPIFPPELVQMLFLLTDPVGTFSPSADPAEPWFPSVDPVEMLFSPGVRTGSLFTVSPGEVVFLTDAAEMSFPPAVTLFWPEKDVTICIISPLTLQKLFCVVFWLIVERAVVLCIESLPDPLDTFSPARSVEFEWKYFKTTSRLNRLFCFFQVYSLA